MFWVLFGLSAFVYAQQDGNPHSWDRLRRCDWDYDPPCQPCEGIGGIAFGDNNDQIQLTQCYPVATPSELNLSLLVKPKWGTSFKLDEGYHEVLIGRKMDPFCFQDFPAPNSKGAMCYRKEEGTLNYDMEITKTLRLDLNIAISNYAKNVSGSVIHHDTTMWIVNKLWFGVQQCICLHAPGDVYDDVYIRPHIQPIQYDWTEKAEFVGREVIWVEYLWKLMELDHWALGPHNIWSDIETGEIVRMWQPFNGLEVLDPTKRMPVDPTVFSIPPEECKKGGAPFRINCDDLGNPLPCSNSSTPGYHNQYCNDDHKPKGPSDSDMERARKKVPGQAYQGHNLGHSSEVLNIHLMEKYNASRLCDDWSAEELQQLQTMLLLSSNSEFDGVYQSTEDNRRLRYDSVDDHVLKWNEMNGIVDGMDVSMVDMHRDGHCAETVMWFVHHLTEHEKDAFMRSGIEIPLLPEKEHHCDGLMSDDELKICQNYKEQVTCATCHSKATPP